MKHRILVPERMDDPMLDPVEHRHALAGLRRINFLCGTGRRLAKEIQRIAAKRGIDSLSALDLGCGGGDVARKVARSTAGKLKLSLCGWDLSPTAIQFAQSRHSPVAFEVANALEPTARKFDVVYCCLFLHHFSDDQAAELLEKMRAMARLSVVVDDLLRTRAGWWLAKAGCHLLSRSPVVHFDGPQSVRAAFAPLEVKRLALRAGLDGATIRTHWPQRFLLRWDAP